ncbi:hypothetical protein [Tropicibacter alexandrii]|uniref:hypothetical protein n=1 Tax=Tropicibacter alexandrii TaxID=2267683 RepID=UPI0013E8E979|nr:hypothetical protein [Tropicibacter alexandrii]
MTDVRTELHDTPIDPHAWMTRPPEAIAGGHMQSDIAAVRRQDVTGTPLTIGLMRVKNA